MTRPRLWWGLLLVLTWGTVPAHAQDGQVRRGPFIAPARSVRTRPFDVKHIRLELTLDWDRQQVHGRAVLTLSPLAPTRELELDAADMEIKQVVLFGRASADATAVSQPTDGQKLAFETRTEKLSILLDRDYKWGEELTIAAHYRIVEPERGVHFILPDEDEPDRNRIVWTQSEPEDARYWFPCLDSPNERLTSEVLATVPEDFFVLSNGVLRGTKSNSDGTQTWHWVQEQNHVPYLISVVAGRFEAYEQSWDGIPIVSHVPPGRLPDAERSFGKTPAMMELFSRKIGYRYPWPKYAQICCDGFGGGMEHTSATTLTDRTLHDERAHLDVSSDGLVAHELAHQWWGDLLTCKDWAEIWLNEGFATYFATLWTEHDLGWDEATWERHQNADRYFQEDSQNYRRPIVTYRYERPWNMFDRHTYPKGGRVLHMLRFVLGEELFWRAIQHYAHKHAFDVVETADLRVAIEEATGRGLNWFFDQWLYHGGHPEYEVRSTWDEEQKLLSLRVRQTQKVNDLTPLFRMPIEVDLTTSSDTVTRQITVSQADETFHFSLEERPQRVCFDPRDWVLKKLTFEKSKEDWLDQLANDLDIMCRVRAAQGLAEFKPDADVLAALVKSAEADPFWAVREQIVGVIGEFTGEPAHRALLQIAQSDPKSAVRRAAIKALKNFPDKETNTVLRKISHDDPSYYAVADALRTLAQVDRAGARDDLLAALDRPSHHEVILKAACDGLAELGDEAARQKLMALVKTPSHPDRRMAAMSALAKLGKGDPEVTRLLSQHLDGTRLFVRYRAVEALAETGDPKAIDAILARRPKERYPRMLQAIDDAVAKLRRSANWQQQIETLQEQNRDLKSRIQKLEEHTTRQSAVETP